jgi:hypothetical protein
MKKILSEDMMCSEGLMRRGRGALWESHTSMAEDTIPLLHRSEMRTVGPLIAADFSIADETPLFAAERSFAHAQGGPLTRAFLDGIPESWGEDVLIDSSLVWLTPGLAHGLELGPGGRTPGRSPPRFIHEPFPCVETGVRAAANRNRTALHRMCVLGLTCTPEFALGEISFTSPEEAAAFWLPAEGLEARERVIEGRLQEGQLRRELIPIGTMIEFGWGTLMRSRPAASSGFQLILRATLHPGRPAVNGRRNLAML